MAAEIVHYAKEGVKSFIILQPFGCLPNHICGRGVIKRIKEDYPNRKASSEVFLLCHLRGGEDSGTERKKTKAYGSKGA